MLINYTEYEKELLARIIRAEALSEGDLGMLMVGNVILNRTIASCFTFKDVRTITDAVYEKNQFSGISNSLFQTKPTKQELRLADKILKEGKLGTFIILSHSFLNIVP